MNYNTYRKVQSKLTSEFFKIRTFLGNPKKFPSPTKGWQVFFSAIVLQLLLPFLPAFLEYCVRNTISEPTKAITVGMWSLSVAFSSSSRAVVGVALLNGIACCSLYGVELARDSDQKIPYFISAFVVFMFHMIERYNRHVIAGEGFLVFNDSHRHPANDFPSPQTTKSEKRDMKLSA